MLVAVAVAVAVADAIAIAIAVYIYIEFCEINIKNGKGFSWVNFQGNNFPNSRSSLELGNMHSNYFVFSWRGIIVIV